MVFDDGNKLTLSPENYLFQHFKVRGAYCLGIFPNGKNPTSLLGGIVVRHTLLTYDRENERISFWKTNCSELLDRQNSSPPPPSPSTLVVSGLDNRNSTAHMSPSPAPSGPPGYNIPDQITATNVAKECLLEALKADSKVAHIWTNLANAYYLMSDHRSSAKCLENAGKIEPNCLATRYAIGVHRTRDAESQTAPGMQNLNEQLSWAGSEDFTASNV
ncbi:hypothetical protein CQW23_14092 [Capsicum baccatum]|uniref:Peptidase A1 domain-containing protein n=1 Tax=Capsicum baccatum TaxID=33114 RepID=A0A2G2WI68_CAPBA|nr:hypothetical protein CQW23_14092 [Capsicum baccatum]